MPFATVSSNCFIKKKKKSLPTRTKPNTPLRVAVVEGEGCSFRCVIETVAALNGRRFLLEPLDIARLSRDKSCLDDIDILVMPGGDDDENLAAGWGRGQRAALGSDGRALIRNRLRSGELRMYVGICAGAFLASNKKGNLNIAPAVSVFKERHFGIEDVRGFVNLSTKPCPPSIRSIMERWNVGRGLRFDQSLAMAVNPLLGTTKVLASYASTVVLDADCNPSEAYTDTAAASLQGKAAVTRSVFGHGEVLLVGPHPKLSGDFKASGFKSLIVRMLHLGSHSKGKLCWKSEKRAYQTSRASWFLR